MTAETPIVPGPQDAPRCAALFISAPASNQGKTTVTAAIARHHRRLGRRVRVFKTGPDFLDPMILSRASGQPVYSLHLWMVGEQACRRLLHEAALESDLILVEGVMGLFDGKPSGADLARTFDIPVLAVIDAQAMAQTFGAIATGLAHYQTDLPFYGVFANRVGTQAHADMLSGALPDAIRWCGHMATDSAMTLPDRHLGLTQADEIGDLESRLDHAADAIGRTPLADLPPAVGFALSATPAVAAAPLMDKALAGKTIAIARDTAFSFIYPANIDLLIALGARIATFSPLANEAVPADADALYLPGGYPELHASRLAANSVTADTIRAHIAADKPTLAECGGMLYLLDSLTDIGGEQHPMLGVIAGAGVMQKKLAGLGMQQLSTPCGNLTGHTFHYSAIDTPHVPVAHSRHATRHSQGEAVFTHRSLVASYFHGYWPSCPAALIALMRGSLYNERLAFAAADATD